jgi:hypothetical protein
VYPGTAPTTIVVAESVAAAATAAVGSNSSLVPR